jgi:hypothetical protein
MHVNPLLDKRLVKKTLVTMLDRVMPEPDNVEYRFLGTAAALLHGVVLPAGDIDILVKERKGVEVFSDALVGFDCLLAPTYLEDMRQYYAEFKINGVEVGISTVEIETDEDWIETYGPGPWIHYVLLPCGSYMVPTVKLELRLITELYRNRPERYDPLIEFMRIKGYDENLLKRGIKSLPEDLQNKVLNRLGSH